MEVREREKAIEKAEKNINRKRYLISQLEREIKKEEDRIRRLKAGLIEK